jgi:tetratricopeptide (TPR) repeat protein
MHKSLTLLILFLPLLGFTQSGLSFQKVDSLSYQYYLKGDWNKLIVLTRVAFDQNIDSKFMRQRAGYAYFMTGDYTSASIQYKKAFSFDQSDEITNEYLYYSALNTGAENSRYYAGNLSSVTQNNLGINRYNAIGMIDTEFSMKTNSIQSRSNQTYYRIGVNTDLGYHFSLYQAYSYYEQVISSILTRQPDYVAILKWSPNPVWQIKGAYHHLFTNVGSTAYPGNLGLLAIAANINRFNFEANTSFLKAASTKTLQMGLQASVVLPGKSDIYLKGSAVGIIESGAFRTIYAQTAGLKCAKNLWAEGNITLGNLNNYNTLNSLYIYNSADPSIFRTGFSLIYFLGKHLSILGNFTFDQQQYTTNSVTNNYFQYSYSGGLKWKL